MDSESPDNIPTGMEGFSVNETYNFKTTDGPVKMFNNLGQLMFKEICETAPAEQGGTVFSKTLMSYQRKTFEVSELFVGRCSRLWGKRRFSVDFFNPVDENGRAHGYGCGDVHIKSSFFTSTPTVVIKEPSRNRRPKLSFKIRTTPADRNRRSTNLIVNTFDVVDVDDNSTVATISKFPKERRTEEGFDITIAFKKPMSVRNKAAILGTAILIEDGFFK